jgi:hypothetical protein
VSVSSSGFAGLKNVDGFGQLPGAPRAAADFAASRVSVAYRQAVEVPIPNPAALNVIY